MKFLINQMHMCIPFSTKNSDVLFQITSTLSILTVYRKSSLFYSLLKLLTCQNMWYVVQYEEILFKTKSRKWKREFFTFMIKLLLSSC